MTRILRVLGLSCFCVFLVCALATAFTGLLMIWGNTEVDFDGLLWRMFASAFLLTVVTGLLVTGTRSMMGVARNGIDS